MTKEILVEPRHEEYLGLPRHMISVPHRQGVSAILEKDLAEQNKSNQAVIEKQTYFNRLNNSELSQKAAELKSVSMQRKTTKRFKEMLYFST